VIVAKTCYYTSDSLRQDVRCVKTPSHTTLNYGQVDFLLRECRESRCSQLLELGSSNLLFGIQGCNSRTDFSESLL